MDFGGRIAAINLRFEVEWDSGGLCRTIRLRDRKVGPSGLSGTGRSASLTWRLVTYLPGAQLLAWFNLPASDGPGATAKSTSHARRRMLPIMARYR